MSNFGKQTFEEEILKELCLNNKKVNNKYTLLKELSKGGQGVVYLAQDNDGNHVALKALKIPEAKASKGLAKSFEQKFKREFDIACRLNHPNVAKIYDFGYHHVPSMERKVYFFTMEYIPDGDIKEGLDRFPIQALERFFLEALRAFTYLGSYGYFKGDAREKKQGLLHLDIKPQNFLLTKSSGSYELKLTDFGLAAMLDSPDKLGGTPQYIAPEIGQNILRRVYKTYPENYPELEFLLSELFLPPPDHRSDIYSLGLTFYNVLAGINPFEDKDKYKTIGNRFRTRKDLDLKKEKITVRPPSDYNPEIPEYLDEIILRMIEFDPDDRYSCALEALEKLIVSSANRKPPAIKTYLSYVPDHIGREKQKSDIESLIQSFSESNNGCAQRNEPLIFISGEKGMGKTNILKQIKPFAQRYDFTVFYIDFADPFLDQISKKLEEMSFQNKTAILIDNLDVILSKNAAHDAEKIIEKIQSVVFQNENKNSRIFIATYNPSTCDEQKLSVVCNKQYHKSRLIKLNQLTEEEMSDNLEYLFGSKPDPVYSKGMINLTFGVPKAMTDIFCQAIENGKLFSADRKPMPDESSFAILESYMESVSPPGILTTFIENKFNALTNGEKLLSFVISCAGSHIRINMNDLLTFLQMFREKKEETLSNNISVLFSSANLAIDQLTKTDLFIKTDENHVIPANIIVSKVIRKHFSTQEQECIHDKIYEFLKTNNGRVESIDYHLARGSDRDKRIKAIRRLTDFYKSDCKPHQAIMYIRDLIDLNVSQNESDVVDLQLELAGEFVHTFEYPKALEIYERLENTKLEKISHMKAMLAHAKFNVNRRMLEDARSVLEGSLKFFPDSFSLLKTLDEYKINDIEISVLPFFLRFCALQAYILLLEGKPELAKINMQKVLRFVKNLTPDQQKQIRKDVELGQALYFMAISKRKIGIFKTAITAVEEELKIFEQENNTRGIVSREYLLAEIYQQMDIQKKGSFKKKVLEHFNRGIDIAKSHHLFGTLVRLNSGLGVFYKRYNDLQRAVYHHELSYRDSWFVGDMDLMVERIIAYAATLLEIRNFKKAADHLFTALYYIDSCVDGENVSLVKRRKPIIYVFIAHALMELNNSNEAEKYLNLAEKEVKNNKIKIPSMFFNIAGTRAQVLMRQKKEPALVREFLTECRKQAKSSPYLKSSYRKLFREYLLYRLRILIHR
ncbi:MAG: protein kinase [Pseudomonadota bacterium]